MRLPFRITHWLHMAAVSCMANRVADITLYCDPTETDKGEIKREVYMHRWYLLPRNPLFNMYLNLIAASDEDRAHHDHPWLFFTALILRGGYIERWIKAGGIEHSRFWPPGSIRTRRGSFAHRLELPSDSHGSLSLFITGPRIREWGFHCQQKGWINQRWFLQPTGTGSSRGCGE